MNWGSEMKRFVMENFPQGIPEAPIQSIFPHSSNPKNNDGIFSICLDLSFADSARVPVEIEVEFINREGGKVKRKTCLVFLSDNSYGERKMLRTWKMFFSLREYTEIWNRSDVDVEINFSWGEESIIIPLYI